MDFSKFRIMFGSFWLFIVGIMVVVFYGGFFGSDIEVNGELMSQAEFSRLLWPKLFFFLFALIGISFIVSGIIPIIVEHKTLSSGEDCHGVIENIENTGELVNNQPVLKATVKLYVSSLDEVKELEKVIGCDPTKYSVGDIFKLKYKDNKIAFVGRAEKDELSFIEEERLNIVSQTAQIPVENTSADVVEINGVKYRKIDE